jgi:hypothetical protein
MPDQTAVVRFDVTNPRAEQLLTQRAGEQITQVTQSVRDAARTIILDGYAKGRGPNDIALDIVGRIQNGVRQGGVLGLTGPQTDAALNLRNRLASGDPAQMRQVLTMGLRDKRFDSTIAKAAAAGKALSPAQIDRMYQQYVNNALRFRGEMIARTETGQAVLEAANEAFAQTLEKTGYTNNAVTKVWRTAHDKKVRDSHASLDGQEVKGLDGVFQSDTGARFLYPMDDSLFASAAEIINCRCIAEYNIDFAEGLKPAPPPAPPVIPPQPDPTPPRVDDFTIPPPVSYANLSKAAAQASLKSRYGVTAKLMPRAGNRQLPVLNAAGYVERIAHMDTLLTKFTDTIPNFKDALKLDTVNVYPFRYVNVEKGWLGSYNYNADKIEMGTGIDQPLSVTPLIMGTNKVYAFNDSFDATFTHEVGHGVTEYIIEKAQQLGLIDKLPFDWWNAAIPKITNSAFLISRYATTNWRETIAEAFYVWTHPDYRPGMLPSFIEQLFTVTLGKRNVS